MNDDLQTRSFELGKSLLLFPDSEAVFGEPVDRHAEHLDPIASIDLSLVSPELSGWIHLVLPIEPGYVGEYTESFHNEYACKNWISFKVTEGRYRFLADFRYFFAENDSGSFDPDPSYRGSFEDLRPRQRASYEERKQRYSISGWDSFRSKYRSDGSDGPLYQFKERAWQSNWDVYPPPPSAYKIVQSEPEERDNTWSGISTTDGRELLFVATVQGQKYRDDSFHGPDETVLFYDPVESIAVLTFDWT